MEAYKYKSGPMDKNGNPTIHWALRSTKQEHADYEVAMANPPPESRRKPHIAVEEVINGIRIRRYVEWTG